MSTYTLKAEPEMIPSTQHLYSENPTSDIPKVDQNKNPA